MVIVTDVDALREDFEFYQQVVSGLSENGEYDADLVSRLMQGGIA